MHEEHVRLQQHLARDRDYRVFVRVRGERDWQRVVVVTPGDELELERGDRVAIDDVKGFVVAYASGEIMDMHLPGRVLPEHTFFAGRAEPPPEDVRLLAADFEHHLDRRITVEILDVRKDGDRHTFRTRLTNTASEPLQIVAFGAYAPVAAGWELSTISEGLFTRDQFIEWYGAPSDGWLAPGASAEDPTNYGGLGMLWVYYVATRDGARTAAGARVS